jgi:hypothetical protein
LALRPERGTPQVVGTTAHLGAGWLDITNQSWEAPRLTLHVSAAGIRGRTVTIASSGHTIDHVRIDGRETASAAREGWCSIPLVVDAPCRLDVSFRDAIGA